MKIFKALILIFCCLFPLSLTACANENKNTLQTPTNINVYNGVIVFNAVTDAEQYVININNQELIVNSNYSNDVSIIDNKINYNANKLFKIGESYSIKIKATADEKEDSSYSTPISYKHTKLLSKPENIKIINTVLTWDLVNNADVYLIKILAPYNDPILDEAGNELIGDDPETIAKADLTEYSFSTNTFDFNSLLTEAGDYKFYINAVNSNRSAYSESGYTSKVTYTHYVKLATPINGSVKQNGPDLYLNTIIDTNSNAVTISCNGKIKEVNEKFKLHN